MACPVIERTEFFLAFPYAAILPRQINGGCFYLVIKQDAGDLIRAVAFDGQVEDTADNRGGFFVNQPVIFIIGVFLIAVNDLIAGRLAGFSLDPDGGALLAAQVADVPLVHDVHDRGEFIRAGVIAVDPVGYGDEAHAQLPKHFFRIEAGGQVVTSNAAHVLDQHDADLPGFHVVDHAIPAGTVEGDAGIAVVRVMDTVSEALLCSVGFEVSFLIGNGTAVPNDVVVAGESFVQGSDLSFSLDCGHVRRSFQTADSFVVQSL